MALIAKTLPSFWQEFLQILAPAAGTAITAGVYLVTRWMNRQTWERDRLKTMEASQRRIEEGDSILPRLEDGNARSLLQQQRACWELRLVAAQTANYPNRPWEQDPTQLAQLAAASQGGLSSPQEGIPRITPAGSSKKEGES